MICILFSQKICSVINRLSLTPPGFHSVFFLYVHSIYFSHIMPVPYGRTRVTVFLQNSRILICHHFAKCIIKVKQIVWFRFLWCLRTSSRSSQCRQDTSMISNHFLFRRSGSDVWTKFFESRFARFGVHNFSKFLSGTANKYPKFTKIVFLVYWCLDMC